MPVSFLSIVRNNYQSLIIGLLLCLGLYLASIYSYILFHIIAEGFSIVIAVSLFLIVWNTRKLSINNYILFISIGFFFSGLIDFVHTLAYKGMGIFQEFDANLPTQLWIISRYLQSLSLLVAPWFIGRKLNINSVLISYSSLTILLLAAAFSGTMFPDCFIEGQGLTPFKIASEYIICLILISSLALLLRHRDKFDPHILRLIAWAITFTIISEMAFTFYVSVYGLSNLIGHYFKILAFYLIYRAIIVTSLKNPYGLLFYDLQKNREEMQIILDASPVMIFYKDTEDRFIRVNRTLAEATGLPREEIEGKTAHEIFPNQTASYWEDDREVIASGRPKTGIIEPYDSASGIRWVQTDKVPYRNIDGSIIGVIGFAVDITERKQAEENLRESEELLKSYLENAPDGIYMSDMEGKFLYGNRMCEKIIGYQREELIGKNFMDLSLLPEKSLTKAAQLLQASMERKSTGPDEIELIHKDGHLLPVEISTSMVRQRGQDVVLAFVRDITMRRQKEAKILKMAYHDSLTGLPNRKLFSDRLGIALTQAQRNEKSIAVTMLDLDNFKDVNDSLGHDVGDILLKAAAERLRAALRKGDTVARFGGDEFVLILPDIKSTEDAVRVADKIVESFRKPFHIDTHQLTVTTSIGIALYPHDGKDESVLLKNADIAMYKAKQKGRDRYHVYKEA
ncbi:MAG TPA: diguanylate cyclase [Desulfobacteraceae bacterium]|nr:diguanylate cyclase [Desulfobacteraceae bacterium]